MNHEDVGLRFRALSAFLDERMRRLVAAAEPPNNPINVRKAAEARTAPSLACRIISGLLINRDSCSSPVVFVKT